MRWLALFLVMAALVLPAGGALAGALGPPAHPPAPPVVPPSSEGRAAGPSAGEPPPPPFDWDPMWFNAPNATGVAGAGGSGAQIAVDDPGGFAIMFGGETAKAGVTNATWLVNETTAIWRELSVRVAPSPRLDFALASAPACGVAVLFGGEIDFATGADTNQTWLFNYRNLSWSDVTPRVGPAPRQGAALAVDDATCQAVMYGGVEPYYDVGNSTGSVEWNDTWVFSLAKKTWTPEHPSSNPPSVADAGLLYDNLSGQFLLYGGCATSCYGNIWEFNLSGDRWTQLPGGLGGIPPSRGGADWSFGWTYDIAVLSMGYTLDGSTKVALNDTYVYEIGNNRWDPVGNPTPTPRYYAAGGWLGSNGCPGFVLVGGDGAPTDPPDQWFLDEAPDIPLACNTWGNDSISSGGGGLTGCENDFALTVNITTELTDLPVAGANVTVAGNCSRSSQFTDGLGLAEFEISWEPYTVTVTDPLYHDNSTAFTPPITTYYGTVNLSLVPLPNLTVNTFQQGAFGPPTPLGNVTVATGDGTVLGTSNATGVFRLPGFWPLGIDETFLGNRTGWADASNTTPIPYTGPWLVNLTLLAPGPIDVLVLEEGSNDSIPGAVVTVANLPSEPPAGFTGTSSKSGWVNGSAPGGNYTATAQLAGWSMVSVAAPFDHPWAAVTVVTINLTSDAGYAVDVRVLDGATDDPIRGADVQVGDYAPQLTGPSGWANLSGIRPAGTYGITAWDTNFTSNSTIVRLSFTRPVWIVVLVLRPLGSCPAPSGSCRHVTVNGPALVPLDLWPSASPGFADLVGAGALLFALPATALILARRRGDSPEGGGRRP